MTDERVEEIVRKAHALAKELGTLDSEYRAHIFNAAVDLMSASDKLMDEMMQRDEMWRKRVDEISQEKEKV